MGLLDTLLGRTKPVRPDLDALFALPSAAVTLATAAGLVPTGHAGVCWRPPAGQAAEDLHAEAAELLADGGPVTEAEDAFGYRWMLVDDPEVDALVTRVHVINATLSDAGWGPQLLCSVFGFAPGPGAGPDTRPLFLVYLFKRGTFYPFAPVAGDKEKRDTELELRIRAVVGADLPFEADLARWFPLWDLPVR